MSDQGKYEYDIEAWERYCKTHTPTEAGEFLKEWVRDGQPDGFLEGCTWRAMCAITADNYGGRYGGNWDYYDFYSAMCTSDPVGISEEDAKKRMERHVRCRLALDNKETN